MLENIAFKFMVYAYLACGYVRDFEVMRFVPFP